MKSISRLLVILILFFYFVPQIYSEEEQHGPFGIEFTLPINLIPSQTDSYQNLHISIKIFPFDFLSIDPSFFIFNVFKGTNYVSANGGFGLGLGAYFYFFSKNPLSIYIGPYYGVSAIFPQQSVYGTALGNLLLKLGLHYSFNKNIALFSYIGVGFNGIAIIDPSKGQSDNIVDQQFYLETIGNIIGIIFYF